ncbi:MAG: uroporphyrinogen-III C-methyltransferase [Oscillatoriales cyanobacterium]|nr:MAG: uroporphyrinogen-III C-methyltransferase [Oscillatoriales cyanobacterium]
MTDSVPMLPPVLLVGAGPGDGAYLTVRAAQALAQAQVLIYDALVDRSLLALVSPDCQLIDVGKRGGQASPTQGVIDQLLVEQWRSGRRVVRLKAGDPFVFGRCTSEIEALRSVGASFEVVPGLSSALAGPLLAGIPLTDPVLSRCFAVASAHQPDALDWEGLARLDTLVFLMAGRSLGEVTQQLIRHGRSPSTPVAVIRAAATPEQRVWVGTVESIALQTERERLSPAIVVVGEVVGLRDFLTPWGQRFSRPVAWTIDPDPLETAPVTAPLPDQALAGQTILVTRSLAQSGSFSQRLQAAGAQVMEVPALEIGPPSSWAALDQAIAQLSQFHWLILTSANGVEAFFGRLQAAGRDARVLAGCQIAVVGKKTAQTLSQFGLQPDFVPPDFVADALVAHFPEDPSDRRILFPRVETGGRDLLVKEFTDRGAEVVEVAAYESRCPKSLTPEAIALLRSGQVSVVTFASSKTVKNFATLLARSGLAIDCLAKTQLASIGPQTSDACREQFDRVDIEATEYTLEGLAEAIETHRP